jgi:phosphonate utilization transcriptional regulator
VPTARANTIALVQSSSLPMLVQQELERMILAGELPAGGKLNEAVLADLLGVSRGPVREAFRALEESGLVRLEKNRGVFVRQISVNEADEIYEVRALLDEWAGRTLAETATAEQVRQLEIAVERMGKAADAQEVDLYYRLNLDFHDRIVAYAGNAKLLDTYRRLVKELSLFRRASLGQGGILPLSTREHRDIVEHIAKRDAVGAGAALRAHVMASRARMHKARGLGKRGDVKTQASTTQPLAAVAARRNR